MKIEELILYKGSEYKGVQQDEFILKAQQNLQFLEDEIAKEEEARVYLKDETLSVVGFNDRPLGKQVFEILRGTLYQ